MERRKSTQKYEGVLRENRKNKSSFQGIAKENLDLRKIPKRNRKDFFGHFDWRAQQDKP